MEESPNGMRSLFGRLPERALRVGLHINETKTEYMVVGRRKIVDIYLFSNVGNYYLNRTKQFKYLGSLLTKINKGYFLAINVSINLQN